ncbi:MAG: hypothetical protein DMG22_16820, partial [Acidobacteria bacterium]
MFGKLVIEKTETPIRRRGSRVVCAALLCGLLLGICAPALAQSILTFDAPGAGAGFRQGTQAQSINRQGAIAGFYSDTNYVYHGFVRAPSGAFTAFDVPGAGTTGLQGSFPLS